jgi:hypothetical protein
MKKAIILSLVFLFYYNGPAHAGWTKVVAEIGEIVILWLDCPSSGFLEPMCA